MLFTIYTQLKYRDTDNLKVKGCKKKYIGKHESKESQCNYFNIYQKQALRGKEYY